MSYNFQINCPDRSCGFLGSVDNREMADTLAATHNQRKGSHRATVSELPNRAPAQPFNHDATGVEGRPH